MIAETLIGTALGGLLRLLPEGLQFWKASKDSDHEFRMAQLNLETLKEQAKHQMDFRRLDGDIQLQAADIEALVEGTKAQGQLSGIKWIDAVNQSVRPVTTFYFLGLYGLTKLAVYVTYISGGAPWNDSVQRIWSVDDSAVLASIIAYWFLDRTLRKR